MPTAQEERARAKVPSADGATSTCAAMAQAPKALRLAPGGSIRPYHDRDEASYGYARVSTAKKHLDLQRDALKQAGWERVFADTASGVLGERPQLAKVLAVLWPGDTLVVWRLDRLGARSVT